MVGDGVFGLVFGVALRIAGLVATADLQQGRIEHGLLGVGMRVEPSAEKVPDGRELVVGFRVVEQEELSAQPVVICVDEFDDVGHTRQSCPSRRFETVTRGE